MCGRAFGGQRKQALRLLGSDESLIVSMKFDRGKFVIVQPGATQALIVPGKAQWLNQVELKTGIGAQANNIAGVRWDFWFK